MKTAPQAVPFSQVHETESQLCHERDPVMLVMVNDAPRRT